MAVAGTPTEVVREMFEALDRKDFAKVLDLTAADVQSVDEISRGWLRGRPAMADYLEKIAEDVSNIRTTLRDIHESVIGELAIVTLGITQRYDLRGQLVEVQRRPRSSPGASQVAGGSSSSTRCRYQTPPSN